MVLKWVTSGEPLRFLEKGLEIRSRLCFGKAKVAIE